MSQRSRSPAAYASPQWFVDFLGNVVPRTEMYAPQSLAGRRRHRPQPIPHTAVDDLIDACRRLDRARHATTRADERARVLLAQSQPAIARERAPQRTSGRLAQ